MTPEAIAVAAEAIFTHQPATSPTDNSVTCTCGQTFTSAVERQRHTARLALETGLQVGCANDVTLPHQLRPTRPRIPSSHPEHGVRHDEQFRTWTELVEHAIRAAQRYDGRTSEGKAARHVARAVWAAYGVFDHNTHLGLGPRPIDFPRWKHRRH